MHKEKYARGEREHLLGRWLKKIIIMKKIYIYQTRTYGDPTATVRRASCHGNQTLPSSSKILSRFFLSPRLLKSIASILTRDGLLSLVRISTLLCLFPKRPMGLTPRPTYQNGSISGPGRAWERREGRVSTTSCLNSFKDSSNTGIWRGGGKHYEYLMLWRHRSFNSWPELFHSFSK